MPTILYNHLQTIPMHDLIQVLQANGNVDQLKEHLYRQRNNTDLYRNNGWYSQFDRMSTKMSDDDINQEIYARDLKYVLFWSIPIYVI